LQEIFVSKQTASGIEEVGVDFSAMHQFYVQHENASEYNVIFNFFYGDNGSQSLGFPTYGLKSKMTGFEYAACMAGKQKGSI
jgi:hypothetical protein